MYVHVWSMALAGWLVGAEIQDINIGFGPRMFKFDIGTVHFKINYIPTGGSVRFGDSFRDIHPVKRVFISVAGCLSLVCLASISFGISETFSKFLNGVSQIVLGAISPRTVGSELLYGLSIFLKENTIFACFALIATKLAAGNMIPIPILNGGDIVVTLIDWIKPIPFKLREYLNQFGLLVVLTLMFSWFSAIFFFILRVQ